MRLTGRTRTTFRGREEMLKKLYIYDDSSFQDRWQAAGRFRSDDPGIVTLRGGSKKAVIDGLDELLARGEVFDRMLIQTHGNIGPAAAGHRKERR
jgi:hypothetical protein